MKEISLPISKSIANRILLLQAIHGDELMPVSVGMPDDVRLMHDALEALREFGRHEPEFRRNHPLTLYLGNCGTALRFLQVHLQHCYPGEPITLDGDPRLKERDGKPTSQTTSARILHGEDIPVQPDESPYITMSRKVVEKYQLPITNHQSPIEADWSAAAFWYEYVAIHGGALLLRGLTSESLQGDRIVADIYAEHFGVETTFIPEGAVITNHQSPITNGKSVKLDFSDFPDLYPAVALTCEKLGSELIATGTERLRYKESDRLEAVRLHEVRNDHRMAMALLAADWPVTADEQQCIAKSYPQFVEQLSLINCQLTITHVTPVKGVNDDGLGKKHALSKLIHAATTEYIWLHDDDVIRPQAATIVNPLSDCQYDLIVLPLRMESENAKPSLLERLQIAEYAAIQELTMRTARKGRAVMCSGANLIVRREVWLECEQDLHPEIPSGDDMFLLEAVKRRGLKVGVIDHPDWTAVVRPQTSWRAFFRQRMRWAGKAPHYTDRDIRRCGMLVAAANILQILCPPVILIKFPFEYALIRRRQSPITNPQSPIPNPQLPIILLLELLYPFYLLVCLIGGLMRQKKW